MKDMLEHLDSEELSEWMAYEYEFGPIDFRWRDDMLAQIHEQLQKLNHLQGAAHFTDKNHKKNPAPEPQRMPRPWDMMKEDGEEG